MTIEELVLKAQARGGRSPKKKKLANAPDVPPSKKSPRDAPKTPGKSLLKPGPVYILDPPDYLVTADDAQPPDDQPTPMFTKFLEKDLLHPTPSESPSEITGDLSSENFLFQDRSNDPDIYKMIAQKMLQRNIGDWENEVARNRIEKKRSYEAQKSVRQHTGWTGKVRELVEVEISFGDS